MINKIFLSFFILLMLGFFVSISAETFGQNVEFQTKDGVIIRANFKKPQNNKTTFILLHGLGSSKNEWQSFATKLQKHGYGFFAYDARGHGASNFYANKTIIDYRAFSYGGDGSQWSKMPSDLASAVDYLKTNLSIKPSKVGIIGASLGANVALTFAANNKIIQQLVLLSPGLNYAEVKTEESIEAFSKRPIFIAASPGDTYAYNSSQILYSKVKQNKNAVFQNGSANLHGVAMFNENFDHQLLAWIEKHSQNK